MKKQIIIVSLSLVVTACASVNVVNEARNRQTVIAYAKTSNEAVKIATHKAERICIAEEKSLKIIELDSVYQGADEKQRELIKFANTILPKNKTSKPYVPLDHTYKATVTLSCIGPTPNC